MPRLTPVPERERQIGRRLREFRLSTKLSQVAVGQLLGIDANRLSSYEHGRVPIPYAVATAFCREFGVNPAWLASGAQPMHSYAMISHRLADEIAERARFSEVFDSVLAPSFGKHQEALQQFTGGDFSGAAVEEFSEAAIPSIGHIRPAEVAQLVAGHVATALAKSPPHLYQALYSALCQAIRAYEASHQEAIGQFGLVARPGRGKVSLDSVTLNGDSEAVQLTLSALLKRLNRATLPTGKKAELADFLGVPRQRVSEWLSGKREPGGETTLKLLNWVQGQEASPTKKP